jgi:hypothetical protein
MVQRYDKKIKPQRNLRSILYLYKRINVGIRINFGHYFQNFGQNFIQAMLKKTKTHILTGHSTWYSKKNAYLCEK